jgi:membrane-bound serine protease (ClpP class)
LGGVGLPGVIGGISLILAFVAFQTLPINYAGLLLIILALILFIAEVKITSYGLLTVGGIISMILGSVMLFESPVEGLHASWKVIIPSVLATAAFFVAALTLALRAQLRKPTTGQEGMIGMEGTASSRLDPKGKVFVNGELWDAESSEPVEDGRPVRVEEVKGMVLRVSKVSR